MDYKEYKESLSTTNGKGDDEYVVDTTEPKDISSEFTDKTKSNNNIEYTYPKDITITTSNKITKVLFSIDKLLQYKNQKYGNSALQPIGIFSKESSEGSILIRLDDKLSRIKNSDTLRKNDVSDIIGYLTLLCVSKGWDDFNEFKD